MYKYTEIFGVDISKDVFDVMNSKGEYDQLSNDLKGCLVLK
jgi:predicted TPR repeat methyltransferase